MAISEATKVADCIQYTEDGKTTVKTITGTHIVISFPIDGYNEVLNVYVDPDTEILTVAYDGGSFTLDPSLLGDMTKAVYDTDDDGTVGDSDKLEGETLAEVQDHTPKAHTLASHSTKAHSELTGVGVADHHAQFENVVEDTTPQLGGTLDCQNNKLSNLLGLLLKAATELTIDGSGVITATQMVHTVDTAAAAGTDNLDTINGGTTVGLIIIRPAHTGRTVVVRDGQGNIELQGGADISLDDITDHMMLFWDTTNSKWVDFGGGGGGGLSNIVEDTTPQLGGDLDLNSQNIDFPTTPNVSDCKDEDDMASDSATMLATQQSIKAYADTKSSVTTATMTVYVDGDASGAADGTSWTDAFTTIQAAWDSLPSIIAHAVTIQCREATNPYRETVNIDSKYVIASVTIEGEFYLEGDCEANAGGAGEITDTGAFGSVVVGDKVYVLDLNGANGRAQNYEVGAVDSIANAPNRIGTDLTVTPSTGWKYVIVRTEISGSDDGTDGGTARNNCFAPLSIDNITIKGFYVTFSDSYAVHIKNSRYIIIQDTIFKDCDAGIVQEIFSDCDASYYAMEDCGGYATYTRFNSKLKSTYCALDGATAGAYSGYLGFVAFDWCYIATGTYGMRLEYFSGATCFRTTIAAAVGTGFYVRQNSCVWEDQSTNSATTPEDPVGTSEGAYID